MKIFLYICLFSFLYSDTDASMKNLISIVETINPSKTSVKFVEQNLNPSMSIKNKNQFIREIESVLDDNNPENFTAICLKLNTNCDTDFLFTKKEDRHLAIIVLIKDWLLKDIPDEAKIEAVNILLLTLDDILKDDAFLQKINLSKHSLSNLQVVAEEYSDSYSSNEELEYKL